MKKILILGGGISKERKISLETAKQVNKVLNRRFRTFICEPNNDLIKKIKTFKPDLIFNALHGRFGEDGYIQSILEKFKIKYSDILEKPRGGGYFIWKMQIIKQELELVKENR